VKKSLLFLAFLPLNLTLTAQDLCPDDWALCDSVSISTVTHPNDSVIYFEVHSEHVWLSAPEFLLCPDTDLVTLVDPTHSYFGLQGSITVPAIYRLTSHDFPEGFELNGRLIVNNVVNPFPHCQIPFQLLLGSPNGMEEPEFSNSFLLYPNPTQENVQLQWTGEGAYPEVIQAEILDVTGRILHSESVTFGSSETVSFNLSGWAAGLFFVRLQTETEHVVLPVEKLD